MNKQIIKRYISRHQKVFTSIGNSKGDYVGLITLQDDVEVCAFISPLDEPLHSESLIYFPFNSPHPHPPKNSNSTNCPEIRVQCSILFFFNNTRMAFCVLTCRPQLLIAEYYVTCNQWWNVTLSFHSEHKHFQSVNRSWAPHKFPL